MGKEYFRIWQLFPHLGQKGRAGDIFFDNDAVNVGPEFGDKIRAVFIGQRFGLSKDAYFNVYFFKFF